MTSAAPPVDEADAAPWRRLPLFAALSAEEVAALAAHAELRDLAAGEALFEEGDSADSLCVVVDGRLRIAARAEGLAEHSAEVGRGGALGAFSLIGPGIRSARAETLCRSQLLLLPRAAYRAFADAAPRAACRLLEALLRDQAGLARDAARALVQVDRATLED